MNALLRVLATLAIAAILAVAVRRWCVVPWTWNERVKSINRATDALWDQRGTSLTRQRAEAHIFRLRECPDEPELAVIKRAVIGSNAVLQERQEIALRAYADSMRWDRRPELLTNLAQLQWEAGQRDEAVRNVVVAASFNPFIMADLPEYDTTTLRATADRYLKAHPRAGTQMLPPD